MNEHKKVIHADGYHYHGHGYGGKDGESHGDGDGITYGYGGTEGIMFRFPYGKNVDFGCGAGYPNAFAWSEGDFAWSKSND
jgi:hypothetical protein